MAFLPSSSPYAHGLPLELMDALNQTYFLHLLLTDPGSVIPPGKSLLSMLVQANFVPGGKDAEAKGKAKDAHEAMVDRVKEVAHRAFWAEALEALSSPTPAVQIPRLKRLYLDLHEALAPLFPPAHLVIVALSSPLPPTSSPLLSTLDLLKDIVKGMRQRCAPIRDAAVDALDIELGNPPEPTPSIPLPPPSQPQTQTHSRAPSQDNHNAEHPGSSSSIPNGHSTPPPNPLASFVIAKIRAVLELAELMKSDLNTFVLGAMSEDQLRAVLLKDVRERERQLVSVLWALDASGRDSGDVLTTAWDKWVDDGTVQFDTEERRKRWVKRLVGALGGDAPVRCNPPTAPSPATSTVDATGTSSNAAPESSEVRQETSEAAQLSDLPPQLFFSQPGLLYIQNYLQAIVISAALRSLTRLPPPNASTTTTGTASNGSDFMHRVWTLLKGEIDADRGRRAEEDHADAGDTAHKEQEEWQHTKLVNLADEVVRARKTVLEASGAMLSAEEETQLRAAVERTLRTTDPVFLLLRKRLLGAIETRLADALSSRSTSSSHGIPVHMQTGKGSVASDRLRDERAGKRMRLMLPEEYNDEQRNLSRSSSAQPNTPTKNSVTPGFEELVLQDAIRDVLQRTLDVVDWVAGTWDGLEM